MMNGEKELFPIGLQVILELFVFYFMIRNKQIDRL